MREVFLQDDELTDYFCRLAYGSRARIVVLPLQDVLGLDGHARMNTPAEAGGNWLWRLVPGQISEDAKNKLRHWTGLFNRR